MPVATNSVIDRYITPTVSNNSIAYNHVSPQNTPVVIPMNGFPNNNMGYQQPVQNSIAYNAQPQMNMGYQQPVQNNNIAYNVQPQPQQPLYTGLNYQYGF